MILLLFPIVIGVFGKGVVVFLLVLFAILYIIEFVYVTVVWQISSVAAALEDYHGFITPEEMVVQGWSVSPLEGAAFGVLCFLLLSCSFPFWFVVQTAFYFVCKSYHNENIDKSALADRLEGYANNGSPDVQLKQNQV
ncbi:hypothetical protein JHK84_035597 [Glycine max]|uniref:Uncharacterized protein n=1 Tax=Glycine soja TaxID=3848 RepID=A0A0B2QPU6_GLYSO|nr:hypothetical protein JHK87_035125 [Glycine soja]KAG4975846.1 hypothetical protein JHK86_035320 [Glycine max]KAG5129200.1 hypothetical protein JHK84_035597 [Glycine max]KHN21702.1 hypothetical protein glysoja_048088 [Glycine soja]